MRIAVTGARGRLGRALVEALEASPYPGPAGPIAWSRPEFDLDDPGSFAGLLDRDRPEVIVHAAAWTDVDGAALEPAVAQARNAQATGALAVAAAARQVDLIVVSTNEVFDGTRTDRRGYAADDAPRPGNPYGATKLEGERAAIAAYRAVPVALGIVRTAWLFGPPGNDFPDKILAAAEKARASGQPLKLVADEVGSPTYSVDLAEAIVELIAADAVSGVHHIVNGGVASRADWGREVVREAGIDVETVEVSADDWPRASAPPRWAVLEPTALPGGEPLRSWQAALADYLPALRRQRAIAR